MRSTKIILILLSFLSFNVTIYGQEWASRISIVQKNLIEEADTPKILEKGNAEASDYAKEPIAFFSTDASFNLLTFSTKNNKFGSGFHGTCEEFLPNEQPTIQDFFMYSFELYANITKSLRVSLSIENFFNLNDSSLEIEPVKWNSNNIANLITLEHATAHFTNISINYSF